MRRYGTSSSSHQSIVQSQAVSQRSSSAGGSSSWQDFAPPLSSSLGSNEGFVGTPVVGPTPDEGENLEVLQEPPPVPVRMKDVLQHADWQGMYSTIRQRSKLMFNNELMADVHFLVGSGEEQGEGPVRIPAHGYVLATGSSVFYAMLYGPMAQQREGNKESDLKEAGDSVEREIVIPDIEPRAFLNLLRYLYCDETEIEEDTVIATLYASKKYLVPHMAQCCVNYLLRNLTAKNVCILVSHSRLFDETELTQRCWEVLDPQTKEALESESFVDIDRKTLAAILSRETLTCREIDLFRAVQRWAAVECERQDLEPTPTNQKTVLDNLLFLVRVPTMRLEEFANHVAQSGLLDLKLVTEIFLYFTAVEKPSLPFPLNPRLGLSAKRCHRFQSSAQRSNQWRYRGRCDSIQFQVNSRVFVAGFGLYGSAGKAPADYHIKMELKRESSVLARTHTSFKSDGTDSVFPAMFEHPVQIEPGKWYTASVLIDGRELSWFGQEGMAEVQVSSSVTFQFQCSGESTNGTGVQGGQIPEIVFYG